MIQEIDLENLSENFI